MTQISFRLVAASSMALVALGSCFAEPNGSQGGAAGKAAAIGGKGGSAGTAGTAPDEVEGGQSGAAPVIDAPKCVARPAVEGASCYPVISGEMFRSRIVENVPQDTLFFTETLFGEFKTVCGSCHGASAGLGGFSVSRGTFSTVVDDKVLKAIRSQTALCERDAKGEKQDANCFQFMPPDGNPNGKPWNDRKDVANDPVTRLAKLLELWIANGRPDDAFVIKASAGLAFTTPYAIDAEMSETFSNIGTCVPDAGMVATELDQSCALDGRFAAMRPVLDSKLPEEQIGLPTTLDQTDLNTWDSAELARHGVVAYAPTYPLWTDDAAKLRMVRVPQGESIAFDPKTKQFDIPKNTRFYKTFLKKHLDTKGVERYRKVETRLIVSRPGEQSLFGTYLWNEEETQATLHVEPLNSGLPFKDKLLTLVLDEKKASAIKQDWMDGKVRNYTKELDRLHLLRRYAVPSSARCVQCHMGGPGGSFVLGFMPLDLYARPCDLDTVEKDGMCEGGVIEPATGDNLTQLERFIDYGVISNYDIKTDLVSLEDPQGTSSEPRKFRSPEELRAQGYLLANCSHCHNPDGYPSVLNPELKPLLNFRPSQTGGIFEFPLERYSPRIFRQQGKIPLPYITPSLRDIFAAGAAPKRAKVAGSKEESFIDAPWRSLIYRNVDTPFTYTDDQAIYPHMPLNSPGFDCRAPRIVGEWMVSVPALRKDPDLNEDPDDSLAAKELASQPYYEVKEGDAAYLNGVAQARKRLIAFRNGTRAKYCPDTSDIVDLPEIVYGQADTPQDGAVRTAPLDGVPDRSHWVITDLSDIPPPWNPRRTDWKTVLVNQDFSSDEKRLAENPAFLEFEKVRLANQQLAVGLMQGLDVSGTLKSFLETKLAFGVWQRQAGCDFSSVPYKVKDFPNAEYPTRPRWMDADPRPDPMAPVFETSPGAAVFNMVCVNCHGSDADSTGRQASTLQEMTGGIARVANFRDGFFGPFGKRGENRHRIFGDDASARHYLAWMALGGTTVRIPKPILDLVAATPVLGAVRPVVPSTNGANMLEAPRELCRQIVMRGANLIFEPSSLQLGDGRDRLRKDTGFIAANGDEELWERLCTLQNPAPIHAITVDVPPQGSPQLWAYARDMYRHDAYPTGRAVGTSHGQIEASLSTESDYPWCVIPPTDPAARSWLDSQKLADGKALPECPSELLLPANTFDPNGPELTRFATRGAINAGFAVFEYLNHFVSDGSERPLGFAECSKLPKAGK